MSRRPFSVERVGDVLELWLDTPGCDVNILSYDAATQLLDILAAADPTQLSAVVIKSRKPRSFINGVGLIMAGTTRNPEDAERLTEVVRRTYRALRAFPIPTIAAIRGNCYGCGVELTLHCDYRVAVDTQDTHFYMTEIADYLFVPAFGSTQDLPRLLGLEGATDLLLWGERWRGREAVRRGLADQCVEDADLDGEIARLVDRLRHEGKPKRALSPRPPWSEASEAGEAGEAHDTFVARTRARILALPPMLHQVYGECFELMVHAARSEGPARDEDYDRELVACGRSVIQPIAKAALSFFFVRQLAHNACLRTYEPRPWARLAVDADPGSALDRFRQDLVARRVRALDVTDPGSDTDLLLVERPDPRDPSAIPAAAELRWEPREDATPIAIYAPLLHRGIPLVEIVMRDDRHADRARELFAIFDRAGFVPVLTRAGRQPEVNELCIAFLCPLVAYVAGGGRANVAYWTLRYFGFARSPAELVLGLGVTGLARLLEQRVPGAGSVEELEPALHRLATAGFDGGGYDERILDAVLISLLGYAARAVDERLVAHHSIVDVMAREVIDFPLALGSLCRHLTKERAAEILSLQGRFSHLLPADLPARSERFAKTGRDFYEGKSRSTRPPVTNIAR